MNCIWILLLLCCCGTGNNSCGNNSCGNNSCGNVSGNGNHNHCDHNHCNHNHDCDCDCVRERGGECDSNTCGRIIPPIRNDFGAYSHNDRCDDNDYGRRSGDYDRRDRRCETCGCEAE